MVNLDEVPSRPTKAWLLIGRDIDSGVAHACDLATYDGATDPLLPTGADGEEDANRIERLRRRKFLVVIRRGDCPTSATTSE